MTRDKERRKSELLEGLLLKVALLKKLMMNRLSPLLMVTQENMQVIEAKNDEG